MTNRYRAVWWGAGLLALISIRANAQAPAATSWWHDQIAQRPDVRQALGTLERTFPAQLAEWIRITQIPGTSTHEQRRAQYVVRELAKLGLTATVDSIGNVTLRLPGTGAGPTIAFAAHLDVVHPLTTDVTVRTVGDTLKAPGVFDNSASVTNALAVVRALRSARVKTKGTLIFVWTTQEELGLRGMAYWLDRRGPAGYPDMLVAMDGGLGPIAYGALGIYWTRYAFHAAGAHTLNSVGKPHPARALADAIRSIYEITVPTDGDGAVYNVGILKGGDVVNAIPRDVSFTMDLRSVDPKLLDSLDTEIERRVADVAQGRGVTWTKELIQRNLAGGTTATLAPRRAHPIVGTAVDVHRFLNIDIGPEPAIASGSTDANVGVVRGIPSISVGRGWGGDQHTLREWALAPSALDGTKMVLLLAVTLADGAR